MLMLEIPAWITLATAIAIMILVSGILWDLTDIFRRSRWVLRNTLTGEHWTTSHSSAVFEIHRLMKQRHLNSELIRRSDQ
jgi:hypothetical protein